MLDTTAFFAVLVLVVCAAPVHQFRDVSSLGPSGTLDIPQRWRDTVGTATQVWMNGPVKKNFVLHTSRTGPLSSVYRDALHIERKPCELSDEHKCEVAINGFGTVGEVQYDFEDGIQNVKGRSTQVMVACRCVGRECGKAVLIRPVNVYTSLDAPSSARPDRRTCLYEAIGNSLSDCHTELLRRVRRPIYQRAEYTHGSDPFVYNVHDGALKANWTAQGQRGWTRDCLASEVNALKAVNLDEPTIAQSEHSTPASNGCKPPSSSVTYFQDADLASGEECYSTYEYASTAASFVASQQDEIAIGNREQSYFDQKPPLVSNTELALTCSAAGLGVLFVGGMFRKQLKKTNTSDCYLATVIIIQIMSYMLEALPLHMALGQEIDARDWKSEFAFLDGSVALASDQEGPQGSADGSLLVLTAVLGTVQYQVTRVSLVAGFTAVFDGIALFIIFATFLKKVSFLQRAKKESTQGDVAPGWMTHVVGLHSRELQRQTMERYRLEATAIQALALDTSKGNEGGRVKWKDQETAAARSMMSTESFSVDAATSEYTFDAADHSDVFDVANAGELLDIESTAVEGMRQRGSSLPQETLPSGDGFHTPQERMEEHHPDYPNASNHDRQ